MGASVAVNDAARFTFSITGVVVGCGGSGVDLLALTGCKGTCPVEQAASRVIIHKRKSVLYLIVLFA